MKRILFGAVFVSVLSTAPLSAALAADMAVKAPWAGPAPTFAGLWDGLYVGGNIGGAWAKSTYCTDAFVVSCLAAAPVDVVSQSATGVVGGGQTGYRMQFGNAVFGAEAMLDGLRITQTMNDPHFPTQTRQESFSGIMSVTGSVGIAVDRVLLYGKGGWALTNIIFQANNPAAPGGPAGNLEGNEYQNGWTAGAGLEYMLPSHWSLGVEYNYYRFSPGDITNVVNGGGVTVPCAFCNFGSATNIQTVLARLNVRIGGPTREP
jgi:outer membrane immunogenic protein